jgi:hypothetical protein
MVNLCSAVAAILDIQSSEIKGKLVDNHTRNIPAKFPFKWFNGYRVKDFSSATHEIFFESNLYK